MYYISDFCRVCLQYEKPVADILKKEADSEPLINKLKLCVSEVEWSINESILMCQLCIEKLNSAFEFKRQCLESTQTLANYITQLDGSEDLEEKRLVTNVYVSVSRNEVSRKLVDEYLKIQKEEEESQKPIPFIRVKPNQQLYPQIPNIILTANNTNQNTFQNIFLNLIPSSAIKYQPPNVPNVAFTNRVNKANVKLPSQVKDGNQNMFLNINNTLHKIFPIVAQSKENKPSPHVLQMPLRTPEDVNISRILTESKTEELSVEIDPMCFDCSPEDDQTPDEHMDFAKDWDELILSNKIGPEEVNTESKPKLLSNIPALTKLSESSVTPSHSQVQHAQNIQQNLQNTLNNIDYANIRVEKPFMQISSLNHYVPIRPKAKKDYVTAELEEKMMEFLNVDHFMAPKEKECVSSEFIPKSLSCEQCGQMCETLKALRCHIKQTHLGNFPYKCKYCSSMYALRTQYESHMQKHIMSASDTFFKDTITLEDLSVQSETLLFPKLTVPTPTTPTNINNNNAEPKLNSDTEILEDNSLLLEYKCEMCPRSFNSSHGLSRHKVRKHNEQTRRKYFVKGMKNAKCDICNREFSTQSYLQLHIKLHYRKNDYRLKVFNKDKYEKKEQQETNESSENKENSEIQDSKESVESTEEKKEEVIHNKENIESALENKDTKATEAEEKSDDKSDVQSLAENKEDSQENQPLKGIKIKINLRNLKQSKSEKCEKLENSAKQNIEVSETEDSQENNLKDSINETPMEVDNSKEETLLNGDLSKGNKDLNNAQEDKILPTLLEAPTDMNVDCDENRELLSPNAELSEEAESLKDEGSPDGRRPPIKIVLVNGKPQCTFCYKLFGRKHDLKRHLNNIHLKAIQYMCHLCNSQFYEAFHLTRHLRQHNGFVRCTACMKDFSVLRDLKLHIGSAHDNCAPSQCGTCGQSFQRVKHLREHMREHDKTIIYKCHICSEEFKESRELSKHLVAHSGMYVCNICQTTFTNEQELGNHSKCHLSVGANEKRYECEICHNRYKKKRYLMTHMNKSHSANKNDAEILNNRVESDNDSS